MTTGNDRLILIDIDILILCIQNYRNYIDSIASPVWIKRVAASGGLLFRGRHSLVSPSLLYILGVRWNKARGQSSTRQGAFDKKGARSLLQIRFHFFVTVLHDASCFCRCSASFLSIWLQSSIPRSSCECLLPLDNHDVSWQAVLCSWHTVLIPFCHAGPSIKAMATHRLFLHTKTTWRLVVFCFQVLSRWYEVGEPKLRVNRSFVPSFDHLLQSPIKVFGAVHYQVALEALLGGPEKKLILENLEWYETETHTVKDQQSRN